MRIFLAFCVVLYHLKHFARPQPLSDVPIDYDPPLSILLSPVYEHGHYAVQVFFFLSGVIIIKLYKNGLGTNRERLSFIGRRLARIYPVHLISFLFVAFFASILKINDHVLFITYSNDFYHAILNILLIHNTGLEQDISFNAPSWSLGVEFICYVIVPLTFLFNEKHKTCFFIMILIGIGTTQITGNPSINNLGTGFIFFFSGALWQTTSLRGKLDRLTPVMLIYLICIGIVSFILSFHLSLGIQKLVWISISFPLVILSLFALDLKVDYLSRRPYRFYGELSFSLYMWHFPAQVFIFMVWPKSELFFNSIYLLGTYLILSLAFSLCSYIFFEAYTRKKILHWLKITKG